MAIIGVIIGGAVLAGAVSMLGGGGEKPIEAAVPPAETRGDASYQQPALPSGEPAGHFAHAHEGMVMDMQGAVMNENKDRLPQDCPAISEEVKLTVRAGRKYARGFPGLMFSYDQHQWDVQPCSRVTVRFINEDDIRHQWMIHGLPKYIHPQGMFHIEVTGPGEKTGTFIVPSLKRTYFVHCDMAQHTEKGLTAQLKAGGGDMDLPSIPGLTGSINPSDYAVIWGNGSRAAVFAAGMAGLFGGIFALVRLAHGRGAPTVSAPPVATPRPAGMIARFRRAGARSNL
ncbi:MAG: copper oxidase [Gammaproteobacteria bacterium]